MSDPRVKPLQWSEMRVSDKRERFEADSAFGSYEALEWSGGGYGGTFAPVSEDVDGLEFNAKSIEAAKDICERDYIMRVASLLNPL